MDNKNKIEQSKVKTGLKVEINNKKNKGKNFTKKGEIFLTKKHF